MSSSISNLPAAVTPRTFIKAIFREEMVGGFPVFVKTPENSGGVAQVSGESDAFKNVLDGTEHAPWHYCVSYCRRDEGVVRRRKQDVIAPAIVVLDDVGTKVKMHYLEGMPPASFKLETSEGNFQWGYILEFGERDIGKFEALMRALAEKGLTDAGSIDAAHVFRLPGSIKAGGTFRARLTSWNPTLLYTVDGLALSAGIDLLKEDTRFFKETPADLARERRDDVIYDWMVEQGLVYGRKNQEGYMTIECPWSSQHTPGTGSTADYLPLGLTQKDGDRYFHCHHGHCQDKHTPDFMRWADERGAPKDSNEDLLKWAAPLIAEVAQFFEDKRAAEAAQPKSGMPAETMSELRAAAANMPDPEMILGPFQTGTWGILAALPGVGKSMFLAAIARAVSLGVPLGDYPVGRQRSIGIVDAEMSEREIDSRMPMDTPDTVHWITTGLMDRNDRVPFSLGNRHDQQALMDLCVARNISVLFIDNIEYTLEPAPGKDVWHPETWRQVVPLIRWAKQTGRLLVFIDHLNAQGGVQGSLSKQRGASFVMKLESEFREDGDTVMCFKSQFVKIRYMTENKLKADRTWWLDHAGDWNCERERSKTDQIAALLIEGVKQKDIAKEVGLSEGRISQIARKLKVQSEQGKALLDSERKHWRKPDSA